MRTIFDMSYLYHSPDGFDQRLGAFDNIANLERTGEATYETVKTGKKTCHVDVAVAGFTPDELANVMPPDPLVTTGPADSYDGAEPLNRGGTVCHFTQSFNRADIVRVTEASMENGALSISLFREVPEATNRVGSRKLRTPMLKGKDWTTLRPPARSPDVELKILHQNNAARPKSGSIRLNDVVTAPLRAKNLPNIPLSSSFSRTNGMRQRA